MTLVAVARAAVLAALWRLTPPEPPAPSAWRLYESPDVHVGLRPAVDWGNGIGLTLQVTVRTPW